MTELEQTPEQEPVEIAEALAGEIVETPAGEIVEALAGEIVEPEAEQIADPVVEPIVEPEVISVIKLDPKKSKGSMPVPAEMVSLPETAGPAVVGDGAVDPVYLSKAIYKNLMSRKSLTIHHLQRRLVELGYAIADADKDGWYGDGTQIAIDKFRADRNIEAAGQIDEHTFLEIFKGDPNVDPIV